MTKTSQQQCFDRLTKDADRRKEVKEKVEKGDLTEASTYSTREHSRRNSVVSTKSNRKMSIKESDQKYYELMTKKEQTTMKVKKLEEELKLKEL